MDLADLLNNLKLKGIKEERILNAIALVPREKFIDESLLSQAYEDRALGLSCGQTISQPYIVAKMTQLLLADKKLNKVLEIGTGSGYQAAILSHCVKTVYSIERIQSLYEIAKKNLQAYPDIHLRYSDGYFGWPEEAPFDGIIVTCAIAKIPDALLEQLQIGAHLVLPLGDEADCQILKRITKKAKGYDEENFDFVRFVPFAKGIL